MPEKFGNDVRNWLVQLKMTCRLTNLVDEPVDERVDEPVDEGEQVEFQEEEQPEQDLLAAEIMLRRVHANFVASK